MKKPFFKLIHVFVIDYPIFIFLQIVGYLTESALILGFEPPQSSEGLMASAARDALKKIKTWEQIIGKIS